MVGGDISTRRKGAALAVSALAIGVMALGMVVRATQTPDPQASASHTAGRPPFIVAFELRADRREEFVWPHPSFPRAKYASVLLVVDGMPRVRVGRTGQLRIMTAAHHLKINGRLLEPKDVVRCSPSGRETTCEELVVRLDAGRLRLSLVLPGDAEVDPQRQLAHITLYERN